MWKVLNKRSTVSRRNVLLILKLRTTTSVNLLSQCLWKKKGRVLPRKNTVTFWANILPLKFNRCMLSLVTLIFVLSSSSKGITRSKLEVFHLVFFESILIIKSLSVTQWNVVIQNDRLRCLMHRNVTSNHVRQCMWTRVENGGRSLLARITIIRCSYVRDLDLRLRFTSGLSGN
jgi:hypothetical protein